MKKFITLAIIIILGLITLKAATALNIEADDEWQGGSKNQVIVLLENETFELVSLRMQNSEGQIFTAFNNIKPNESFIIKNIELPKNIKQEKYVLVAEAKEKDGQVITSVKTIKIKEEKESKIVKFFREIWSFWFK